MTRLLRTLATALIVSVALGACGEVAREVAQPRAQRSEQAGSPAVEETKPASKTDPGARPAQKAEPVPLEIDPKEVDLEKPPFSLSVEVSPLCATNGTTVTARVRTIPHADVAIGAAYDNGESYDTYAMIAADGKGLATWRFVVAPQAPPGPAAVLVAAQDPYPIEGEGKRRGTEKVGFEVAALEGCGA